MIIMDKDVVNLAQSEVTSWILDFSKKHDSVEAETIAKEIVNKIDWTNSALMHKGLSWITKNYLVRNNLI